jgi:hypothetical protein
MSIDFTMNIFKCIFNLRLDVNKEEFASDKEKYDISGHMMKTIVSALT